MTVGKLDKVKFEREMFNNSMNVTPSAPDSLTTAGH